MSLAAVFNLGMAQGAPSAKIDDAYRNITNALCNLIPT